MLPSYLASTSYEAETCWFVTISNVVFVETIFVLVNGSLAGLRVVPGQMCVCVLCQLIDEVATSPPSVC